MTRRSSISCLALSLVLLAATGRAASAQGTIPDKATAQCGDGSWSMAVSQRGACSGHTGVKKWIGKKPRGAAARCNDGEYWMNAAAQGACSGHGGVLVSYKKPEKDADKAAGKKGEKKDEKKGKK